MICFTVNKSNEKDQNSQWIDSSSTDCVAKTWYLISLSLSKIVTQKRNIVEPHCLLHFIITGTVVHFESMLHYFGAVNTFKRYVYLSAAKNSPQWTIFCYNVCKKPQCLAVWEILYLWFASPRGIHQSVTDRGGKLERIKRQTIAVLCFVFPWG